MKYARVTERLSGLGSAKWDLHIRGRALRATGAEVIELTIGEPDVPTPDILVAEAGRAMLAGRTGYSNGRGEPGLVAALARRYAARRGRPIGTDQVICLPGTQTCLYAIFRTLLNDGDEVLSPAFVPIRFRDADLKEARASLVTTPRRIVWDGQVWNADAAAGELR